MSDTPKTEAETVNPGTTPGSAEGVDTSEGHDQSEREPAQNNTSTEAVENGALDN